MEDLTPRSWTILVYRVPTTPTRYRLAVWRKLQALGVVYLQDAVCVLPSRPDLDENLQYVVSSIEEMGGTAHLFSSQGQLPGGDDRIVGQFHHAAHQRNATILKRLDKILTNAEAAVNLTDLVELEEQLKRERVGYLRARRIAYFGSPTDPEVDDRLDTVRKALDRHQRGMK